MTKLRLRFSLQSTFILLAAVFFAACGNRAGSAGAKERRPSADEFSVMTYNLKLYGLEDRDGDGQKLEPKPQREREAAVALIASIQPDVLAVQEMGNPAIFEEFQFELKKAGADLPNVKYLQRAQSERNIAVLSRFPIVNAELLTDDSYSIGEAKVPVLRGFLHVEIEANPQYRFHLFVAHLKSKVFHVLGQTEMRRNEARLLNNHVRDVLKANPEANIVVVGDLNDTYQSAALHEALGERRRCLFDLRPADPVGDLWTHYQQDCDQYERLDYILVSKGMEPEVVAGKSGVVRDALAAIASDHRPVVAVFTAREIAPATETPAQGSKTPLPDSSDE